MAKGQKGKYYDGSRLLSMKDIDGNTPEIYLCTSNRTGGKTTWFGKKLVQDFIETGKKFCLLYRYSYELDNVSEKFFLDIRSLFFQHYDMIDKPFAKGKFRELWLRADGDEEGDGDLCGYAVAINDADQVKKYSHYFSEVSQCLMDEFQSESGSYCPGEVRKFISVHISMARGQGKQSRYLPVYMLANQVTILNPYYVALGITDRLRTDTKFLRGNGYVLESAFLETASRAQEESAFNRAFANDPYIGYASQNVYLSDSGAMIGQPKGENRYLCTIRCNGEDYSLREYRELGFLYCAPGCDPSFPERISVTTDDMLTNYVMLASNKMFIQMMRWYFDHGAFRFKDAKSKSVILKMLSYGNGMPPSSRR